MDAAAGDVSLGAFDATASTEDSSTTEAAVDGGDATSRPNDAAGAPDTATVDASGDAGSVGITGCAAPVRVDSLGGVAENGRPLIAAESFGDKYVVAWGQVSQVSPDQNAHVKARAFDGTAFGTEIDLGSFLYGDKRMGSDGAGHAFVSWVSLSANSAVRSIFDFSTLTFSPPTPFGLAYPYQASDLAGAGPGAGLSLYVSGGNFAADVWNADAGWTSTRLDAAAPPPTGDFRLASNRTGQAIAGWYTYNASSLNVIWAMPFDGGGWGAPAMTTPPQTDGGTYGIYGHYAVLSNGDAIFMFVHSADSIQTALFHAGTGTFDAPVVVESMPLEAPDSSWRHVVVADSMDRVTIAWFRQVGGTTHTYASRSFDKGANWSTPVDFGPSNAVQLAVDPSDNVVAATYGDGSNSGFGAAGIFLQATGPTSTTWSAPVQTNVGTNASSADLTTNARILFDTKHHVIVVAAQPQQVDGSTTPGLDAVTCSM